MALSRREKFLLVGLLAVGGLGAFYAWVHQPLLTRRASATALSEQARTELKKDQAKFAKEGDLRSRTVAIAAREKVIDAWVPGKGSAALFIWYLSQAEARSGARITGITVGERRVVTATAQQPKDAPAGAGSQAPPNTPAPPAGTSSPAPPNTQAPANAQPAPEAQLAPGPTLAVIRLNLQVDARFVEHLLFNQALEETPLFLSTDALSLTAAGQGASENISKLVQEGKVGLAAQLLTASPPLDGKYQINLYFKADKAGPTTETMQFPEQAGRSDPFVMNGVDEFIRMLNEHYSKQERQLPGSAPEPARTPPPNPAQGSGQLG